jgi:HEAT repeat protein
MSEHDALEPPGDLATALSWLEDEDPRRRTLAAKTLGRQGPDVASAVPALAKALADPDPMVRSMAASALGRIGSAEAALPLLESLRDPSVPVRFWAVEALARLGAGTPGLRSELERLVREDEAHVKAAAQRALARLPR